MRGSSVIERYFGAEHSAMQWRVAFGVRGRRVRSIGQQRKDGLGATMPAVTRGREQGSNAILCAIDLSAASDERTQQPDIG